MAFSYAKLNYPGATYAAGNAFMDMIDDAMVAAGWTRVNGYNYKATAAYSGAALSTDPTSLGNYGTYVTVGYTCTDSLASSQPFHVMFVLRNGTTAGSHWQLAIEIGDNGTGDGFDSPGTNTFGGGVSTAGWDSGAFSGRILGYCGTSMAWSTLTHAYISAYESGFTISVSQGNGFAINTICIERCRDFNGAILKDVGAFVVTSGVFGYSIARPGDGSNYATPTGHTSGNCYILTSSGGAFTETALGEAAVLTTTTANNLTGSVYMQVSPSIASDTIALLGPYFRSNSRELYGRPRTMALTGNGTFSTLGSNVEIIQDGVQRTFRVPESETTQVATMKVLLATE